VTLAMATGFSFPSRTWCRLRGFCVFILPNCSRIRFRPGWADPPLGNVAPTIPFR
jgi:hypothetical protein